MKGKLPTQTDISCSIQRETEIPLSGFWENVQITPVVVSRRSCKKRANYKWCRISYANCQLKRFMIYTYISCSIGRRLTVNNPKVLKVSLFKLYLIAYICTYITTKIPVASKTNKKILCNPIWQKKEMHSSAWKDNSQEMWNQPLVTDGRISADASVLLRWNHRYISKCEEKKFSKFFVYYKFSRSSPKERLADPLLSPPLPPPLTPKMATFFFVSLKRMSKQFSNFFGWED